MTSGKNPALEKAQNIAFDKIEELELEEAAKKLAEIPVEPRIGSFERLFAGFGGG